MAIGAESIEVLWLLFEIRVDREYGSVFALFVRATVHRSLPSPTAKLSVTEEVAHRNLSGYATLNDQEFHA